MSTINYILIYTFGGSLAALIGGMVLISHEKLALRVSHFLSSFAAGILLGTAFFDLLPEAHHEAEGTGTDIFFWALSGIIVFFLIERFIHWFHHHEEQHEHDKESKSTIPLIIISDTLHNFIDGMLIAATFMINIQLGIVTTFAIFAHEIPQEIGDFGLLLHKGMKRKKIILVNILSAGASFLGAIMIYSAGNMLAGFVSILLALTAGFFIYIATSDLIPEIHYEKRRKHAIFESILLILGIGVMWGAGMLLGHGH